MTSAVRAAELPTNGDEKEHAGTAGQDALISRAAVIGAGSMGSGIAAHLANAGVPVLLLDIVPDGATDRDTLARAAVERQLKAGGFMHPERAALIEIGNVEDDLGRIADADWIVEAVFESRAVKAQAFAAAAPRLAEGGMLASNTSTLSISGLADHVADPARFIGLHFFSPVERMPLVEVIVGKETSARTVSDALAFVARLKKTPIVVHDSPGFYTSRVFCAYIDEAMAMLAEGVSPALIENAARLAGFPVPPLAVIDEVSLDLQKLVIEQAKADGLERRFLRAEAEPVVEALVALGRLGRKSGGGFYDYAEDGDKRLWPGLADLYPCRAAQPSAEDVGKRLLYIQAVESARCLAEGVIDDQATADLGSILGIGYPAWTGGALSVIATVGAEGFLADCARFARLHGDRFEIDAAILDRSMGVAAE